MKPRNLSGTIGRQWDYGARVKVCGNHASTHFNSNNWKIKIVYWNESQIYIQTIWQVHVENKVQVQTKMYKIVIQKSCTIKSKIVILVGLLHLIKPYKKAKVLWLVKV